MTTPTTSSPASSTSTAASSACSPEDLAEELVGDLRDEHDDEAHEEIVPVVVGESWALGGDVHLDELERAIGHPLPEGEAETVSGLLIESLGRLPEEGERVAVDPLAQAAAKDTSGLVSVLDPTDRFCDRTTCHVVIVPACHA